MWQRLIALEIPALCARLERYGVRRQDWDGLLQEVVRVVVMELPECRCDGRRPGAFRRWLYAIARACVRKRSGSRQLPSVGWLSRTWASCPEPSGRVTSHPIGSGDPTC